MPIHKNRRGLNPSLVSGVCFFAERLEPRMLLSAGSVDNTFGVNHDGSTQDFLGDPASLQADGKVIVLSGPDNIVRVNLDGSFDKTFGDHGSIPAGDLFNVNALATQRDGKIIAVGETNLGQMGVARYLPDGTLDTRFGQNGISEVGFGGTDPSSLAQAVVIQRDGKIVIGGAASASQGRAIPRGWLCTIDGVGGA